MQSRAMTAWKAFAFAGAMASLMAWSTPGQAQLQLPQLPGLPGGGQAQSITGQASAVTAVVLGNVTSLADTGTLTSASEPLGTGLGTGSIPGLLGAEALHAATMGWTDQVVSQASLANLAMSVAGIGISAGTIVSTAKAIAGGATSGAASVEGLNIGGIAVPVSGLPNQAVSVLGLTVILNEQLQSASGIVVNALRIRTLDGLTDVAVGSAKAGI